MTCNGVDDVPLHRDENVLTPCDRKLSVPGLAGVPKTV
jgi:hypothetical protein